MEQRKTQHEILDELVREGRITTADSQNIRTAPVWSFEVRELLGYLAAAIIGVGVIRIVAVVLEGASRGAIATLLYIVAVVLAYVAWRFRGTSPIKKRLGEVCELGAVGALCGATGLVLSYTDISAEVDATMISSVVLVWSLWRARHSLFAGTIEMVIATPVLCGVVGSQIQDDRPYVAGILLLVSGAAVLWYGWQEIGVPFLARVAGSMFSVVGAQMLGDFRGVGLILPIVVGAALFGIGSLQLAPEMLLIGAGCTIIGIVRAVMSWVHNDLAQGIVIVATGLAILAVLGTQMRRAVSGRSPGAPTASVGS